MIRTRGLTHVALAVADPVRAFNFYREVFGVVEVYRGDEFVQAQTPGSWDVLVFERKPDQAGKSGGLAHFGFRLTDPADISAAAEAVKAAGGTVREQGEFCPGEPYLYATDPDGYEVEIWFEIPTPVDPRGGMDDRVREFAELAREYCSLCDNGLNGHRHERVNRLFRLLTRLCAGAEGLPWSDISDRPEPERVARPAAVPTFERDYYRVCFDPFDMKAPPVEFSISDDLSDIYVDLHEGLDILERGTVDDERDAVWAWKWSFENHWGYHAMGAMRALYWIRKG